MTRPELMQKYEVTLKAMAEMGEDGDKDVLLDKLIYMAGKEEIGLEGGDEYKIPEGFDYVAFNEDRK